VLGLKIDNGEMFERLLEEETIPLQPGDLYLFFTDGISEAMNAYDDCFGETRLGQLVESHAHLPSDQLRERVLREIAAFVGDAPQHDDMTMIPAQGRRRSRGGRGVTWSKSFTRIRTSKRKSCAACSKRTV